MAKINLRDRPDPLPIKNMDKNPDILCPDCIRSNNCAIGRTNNYSLKICGGYVRVKRKYPHIMLGPQHVETIRIQES